MASVYGQMVRYVHNISMNDRYKTLSIHIHMCTKYYIYQQVSNISQISKKIAQIRGGSGEL